jgi:hypothetical protein
MMAKRFPSRQTRELGRIDIDKELSCFGLGENESFVDMKIHEQKWNCHFHDVSAHVH